MHDFLQAFCVEDSNSDKITHHGYQRIYPWFLEHLRQKKVTLLEIGILESESVKLWGSYFEDIFIHGIDINEKKSTAPNVKMHQVDQSDRAQLENFTQTVNTAFDIILDDGSHVPSHQIQTLLAFWALLKPGGIYIVEDIETSYWGKSQIYGYPFDTSAPNGNFIKFAMNFILSVNQEFIGQEMPKLNNSNILDEIEMVSFAHNCVILIKKDPENFSQFYKREYSLKHMINSLAPRP